MFPTHVPDYKIIISSQKDDSLLLETTTYTVNEGTAFLLLGGGLGWDGWVVVGVGGIRISIFICVLLLHVLMMV